MRTGIIFCFNIVFGIAHHIFVIARPAIAHHHLLIIVIFCNNYVILFYCNLNGLKFYNQSSVTVL